MFHLIEVLEVGEEKVEFPRLTLEDFFVLKDVITAEKMKVLKELKDLTKYELATMEYDIKTRPVSFEEIVNWSISPSGTKEIVTRSLVRGGKKELINKVLSEVKTHELVTLAKCLVLDLTLLKKPEDKVEVPLVSQE